jgi:zinc/manganese transport system substrate-binding protein
MLRAVGIAKPFGAVAAVLALAAAACGLSGAGTASGKLEVVVAESFWGSIATQLAGNRAHVTSLVSSPDVDPHDYDATPRDAQLLARARYVVFNGAGYDPWAPKLLAANPASDRRSLDVGTFLGAPPGANPHFWYSPTYVDRVVDRIHADLATLDPGGRTYFDERARSFRTDALAGYHATLATIRAKYAGTPVGASESIFAYMAEATGLDLVTPPAYMNAISEGGEPSAADRAAVDRQLAEKQVRVFVFNSQNSTPDVQGTVERAKVAGIPVVEITETPAPATLSFQEWQTRQLRSLLAALGG